MSTSTPPTNQHSDPPQPPINNFLAVIPIATVKSPSPAQTQQPFRFLDLALEIRLQIYTYLLPPQHHTVTTHIPSDPFFYNSSFSSSSSASSSLYPFGKQAPKRNVSYSVTSQSSLSGAKLRISPEILRVSKQIYEESEPVLYGHPDVIWDFGLGFEGLAGFMGQRSGRASVRGVKGAGCVTGGVDSKFLATVEFMKIELGGLQNIEFTIWGECFGDGYEGGEKFLASLGGANLGSEVGDRGSEGGFRGSSGRKERSWREWEWTRGFFASGGLRKLVVRDWRFGEGGEKGGLDGWLARQMVGSGLVRDRMVREGVVVERRFVVLV